MQYFRQFVQHPPPNIVPHASSTPGGRASHVPSSQTVLRHPATSSSAHILNEARLYSSSRSTGDVARSSFQSSDESSSESDPVEACRRSAAGAVPHRNAPETAARSFSDGDKDLRSPVLERVAADDDREICRVDLTSSGTAEELVGLGNRKDTSSESLGDHTELLYRCALSSEGSLDSGCMSDLSSGGGDSPPSMVSPHQSPISDSGASNEDFVLSKHLEHLQLSHTDDKHCGNLLTPVVPIQSAVSAPSGTRYVRPMREIPPRFRRLLAAEVERMVRLCQRLNGSPLYSAVSGAVRQDTALPHFDKVAAESTPYSAHSQLIYVTAQSSELPVHPAASDISMPVNSGEVEPPVSYVVPVGAIDPSLQDAGQGLPAAAEGLTPSVPMLLANPAVYYYPATSPPDAFSYMVPTSVMTACPPSGTVYTGRPPATATTLKNLQPEPVKVVPDAAVDAFQSATHSGLSAAYNHYYYNSPCPCCSLQLMQA